MTAEQRPEAPTEGEALHTRPGAARTTPPEPTPLPHRRPEIRAMAALFGLPE